MTSLVNHAALAVLMVFAGAPPVWAQAAEEPHPDCRLVEEESAPPEAVACSAYRLEATDSVRIGGLSTIGIDTDLDGELIPATGTPLFIGDRGARIDAITVDSGDVFPGGIGFRRFLGTAAAPSDVTAGTQLGYIDFRGYSGGVFHNAGSLDVIVDPAIGFTAGQIPPTKMRFAVSNGQASFIPMEITGNGTVEINSLTALGYMGPSLLGTPRLWVNQVASDWAAIFAAQPPQGPGFALRLHTLGETVDDYLIGGSSGDGTGSFKFSVRGNGDVFIGGRLLLGTLDVGEELARLSAGSGGGTGSSYVAINGQGAPASATGANAIAIGADTTATSATAIAIGTAATATGANALVLGNAARGNGASTIALGDNAVASGASAVAFGAGSVSTGAGSLAFGSTATAVRDNAVAVGNNTLVEAADAVAVGQSAAATGARSSALGSGAVTTHAGSTALGANARTTAANQVTLGGAGSSVRVGDIAASTAAQVGPVQAVTVDAAGTLGRQSVASAQSVQAVGSALQQIAAIGDDQFNALDARVGSLFDLRASDRKDFKQGIAAVAAMAEPHFPSEAGRTSYASNVAVFRGEVGFSAGVAHRFEGDFALTAGATYAGGKNTAVRAGIAGEF